MEEADDLSSRGTAAFQTGDLGVAEGCFLSSLSIERRLGLKSRLAADYGNLGSLYVMMGNLDAAEDAIKQSLKLGSRQVGEARNYYWYAQLYIKRGELTLAEAMAKKSLDIAIGVDKRTADSARELHEWILARTA
jgi:tetratricopeptide (TPR) repeat protein